MTTHPSAIIIGSGVAGMAASIRLAVQGFDVTVYERNSFPGGKLHAFEQNGYLFDAGPSLFTQPANVEELFALAGEPIRDYFSYTEVDIACRYFYSGGKKVDAYSDAVRFAAELKSQFGEDDQAVLGYLKRAEQLYEHIGTIFLNHSLHRTATWLHPRVLKAIARLRYTYLFSTLNRHNERCFRAPETAQLFNRYATYNGSDPYQAPAMLSLIPHLEQNQGTFYPYGGMISITNALHRLALKKGVRFCFNTPVQKILHRNGRVTGVLVNDTEQSASVVVSNADVYFTYKQLLNDERRAERVLRQERSSSAVIFYWGIGRAFSQLHLHNIFFSDNYQEEFNHIFQKGGLSDDPTVYVNITSKMELGQAPEGKENWFVMVNAPAHKGQNWQQLVGELRKAVLRKLEERLGEPVEPHIETERMLTPPMIEQQTSSYMGSLYGTSSNSRMAAFLRHANFTGHLGNLYFCGGSVHPGGGIPLCLKSAAIIGQLVEAKKSRFFNG
jgi:phytoene desaturase